MNELKRENEQLRARLMVLEGLMATSEHLFLKAPVFHSFDAHSYDQPFTTTPADLVRVRLDVEWEGQPGRRRDSFQAETFGRIYPHQLRRFVVVGVVR